MNSPVATGPPRTFGPPTGAPAGWYPDPYGHVSARYYDGRRWTPYTTYDPRQPFVDASQQDHPVLPFPVVVGAIFILFVSLVTQRQLIDNLVDRDWNVLIYMLLSAVVGYGPSVLWIWFVSRRWGTGRPFVDLGVRFRWQDLGWGPVIWISTHIAVVIVVVAMEAFDVPYRGNLEAQTTTSPERTAVISLIISAVVFAPIVEEALFRGVVMRGLLSKTAPAIAIGIQGVLFGAAHFQPDYGRESIGLIIALSVAGVGFGFGCYLLRRLGPVIIAHACFNALAIGVLLVRAY